MGSETALTFVAVIHLIIALFLIVFVLIQDSKGGAMGALGGGGSNTIFGSSGASSFLVKVTRWTAIAFAATCIFLTMATTKKETSVLDTAPVEASVPLDAAPATTDQPEEKKDK